NTLPQSRRGTLVDSAERRATARRPSAANGSVIVRNVSGGISDTPIFSTGQLQPQISVSTATGRSDDALIDDVTDGLPALIGALRVAAAALRRTCSGAMRGPGSPSRRAGCGPGTRGAWRGSLLFVSPPRARPGGRSSRRAGAASVPARGRRRRSA